MEVKDIGSSRQKNMEVVKIIEEFQEYLTTTEAKSHLNYLKEKEPKETKEIFTKLQHLQKDSPEFVEFVLYGLLPYSKTEHAKRISIAPAFMNIKKFFARFGYSEQDWKELAKLIFDLVDRFYKDPDKLEFFIREFISHRLSKALQCGSLSPIFYSLNQKYPIINNREIRTYRKLSFLVFGQSDELSQKIENYRANFDKINNFTDALSKEYDFKEIKDMAIFDLFCFWFDEYRSEKSERIRKLKTKTEKIDLKSIEPVNEKYITKFIQILACSPPQPFMVDTLKKLDDDGRIIYNTEFQRGEVWDTPRKQKLIDSILRGYNINTIFLRQLGDGRYECLDGQQRLKTVLKGFLKNKFSVNPKFTPEFNRETNFDDLQEPLKNKIRSYIVYAIVLYTNDDEETCKIFLRLQEGLPLNGAEKLNAMIGFLRNEVVQLSQHNFIKKSGIKDYRFSHRYILAQTYLLTLRNQITDIKFKHMQEMYGTYKTTRPSEGLTNTIKRVINFLDKQFGDDTNIIRFNADFISLYLLAKHILDNYVTDGVDLGLKDFFMQFLIKVGEVESSEKEEDAPYYDYKTYRKTSADSKNSIEKRFRILLSKFLEHNQNLVPKDPERDFDYWEKLAVYWRDGGVCQLKIHENCKGKISFEDGTVDHKTPHSKGGKTIINNGQWACTKCNLKKLNKLI